MRLRHRRIVANRATAAVGDARTGFGQDQQIIHLDALCNECGNCASFCPWEGKPYKDKFTVFSLKEDFDSSENPGFIIAGETAYVRVNDAVQELPVDEYGVVPEGSLDPRVAALIETIVHKHAYLLGEVKL